MVTEGVPMWPFIIMSLVVMHESLETCRHFHCRKLLSDTNGHDSVTCKNVKDNARNNQQGADMFFSIVFLVGQRLLPLTVINFVLITIYLNKLTMGHSVQQLWSDRHALGAEFWQTN
jgi:hypothetical protein